MSEFKKIGKISDIKPGEGQSYTVGDRIIGVFNVEGEFFAINDLCPHMGASLSAGHVEDSNVLCPWHAWSFSVKDGTWCDNTQLKIDVFETKIEGDELWVATKPKPQKDEPSTPPPKPKEH
ncbi:MAG: Rieske (2Fe-2S) protein [Planctomycetota bacterium]|nr:Rieske (2Fe-2S) protein [Planctomycetota bacterium]